MAAPAEPAPMTMVSYFNFVFPSKNSRGMYAADWCVYRPLSVIAVDYGCGENGAAFIIWVDCLRISPLVMGWYSLIHRGSLRNAARAFS